MFFGYLAIVVIAKEVVDAIVTTVSSRGGHAELIKLFRVLSLQAVIILCVSYVGRATSFVRLYVGQKLSVSMKCDVFSRMVRSHFVSSTLMTAVTPR